MTPTVTRSGSWQAGNLTDTGRVYGRQSPQIHPVFKLGGLGGRAQPYSYLPKQGASKTGPRSARSSEKLREKRVRALEYLSHWIHAELMETSKPQKVVLLILGAFLLVAWALIIWVATVVTQTALETLQYIIELAQLK
jgi:hypothetical protein